MDKYKATKTLTEKLVKHLGRLIISDRDYKNKLIEEAEHVYITGDNLDVVIDRNGTSLDYYIYTEEKGNEGSSDINEVFDSVIPAGTNYVFLSPPSSMGDYRSLIQVTPYSIIGKKEEEGIKKMFYKNYGLNIREAIETLGIEDFFEAYNLYKNGNFEDLSHHINSFEIFKKELLTFIKTLEYDSANETRSSNFNGMFNIKELNTLFREKGINFQFNMGNDWIKESSIKQLKSLLTNKYIHTTKSLEFFKFVFELPYEDQNLESNKVILKNFNSGLNIRNILLKEYKGKYFEEYFNILKPEQKNKIINHIKESGLKNTAYNSFLWSKGFKDIDLDYLKLYQEDDKEFIKYFKGKGIEEKKIILDDIYQCGFINQKVVDWLNKHESKLVREVGLKNG